MTRSTRPDTDTEAARLRAALADQLADKGLLHDLAWRHAVETIPRHRFVPGFFSDTGYRDDNGLIEWRPVTKAIDTRAWLEGSYSDTTLITQLDGEEPDWAHPSARSGGAPTSSSTLPSLVVRMWQDAEIGDGHSVLEIGTGTGYSTALACERLGNAGDVTSIEVDPHRLGQAATALYGCGYSPDLVVSDGLYGYWPSAPFDRIVAACSVRHIPAAWLAQARPGGKILTTLSGWLYGYARVLLTVSGEATAEGPLLPGTVSFMAARTHNRPDPGNPAHWASLTRDASARPARHSPQRLEDPTSEGFFGRFLAQLAVPDAQVAYHPGDQATKLLIDISTGSVATLTDDPREGTIVRQAGPRHLWDAVEGTWDAWDQAERPGPETFRMSIRHEQQSISHPGTEALSFTLA